MRCSRCPSTGQRDDASSFLSTAKECPRHLDPTWSPGPQGYRDHCQHRVHDEGWTPVELHGQLDDQKNREGECGAGARGRQLDQVHDAERDDDDAGSRDPRRTHLQEEGEKSSDRDECQGIGAQRTRVESRDVVTTGRSERGVLTQ